VTLYGNKEIGLDISRYLGSTPAQDGSYSTLDLRQHLIASGHRSGDVAETLAIWWLHYFTNRNSVKDGSRFSLTDAGTAALGEFLVAP
jgi:hypothetical protein